MSLPALLRSSPPLPRTRRRPLSTIVTEAEDRTLLSATGAPDFVEGPLDTVREAVEIRFQQLAEHPALAQRAAALLPLQNLLTRLRDRVTDVADDLPDPVGQTLTTVQDKLAELPVIVQLHQILDDASESDDGPSMESVDDAAGDSDDSSADSPATAAWSNSAALQNTWDKVEAVLDRVGPRVEQALEPIVAGVSNRWPVASDGLQSMSDNVNSTVETVVQTVTSVSDSGASPAATDPMEVSETFASVLAADEAPSSDDSAPEFDDANAVERSTDKVVDVVTGLGGIVDATISTPVVQATLPARSAASRWLDRLTQLLQRSEP